MSNEVRVTVPKTHLQTEASPREINLKFSFSATFFAGGVTITRFSVLDTFSRACCRVIEVIWYNTHRVQIHENFGEVG